MKIVKIWRSVVVLGILALGITLSATQLAHVPTATPNILAGDDTKGAGGG